MIKEESAEDSKGERQEKLRWLSKTEKRREKSDETQPNKYLVATGNRTEQLIKIPYATAFFLVDQVLPQYGRVLASYDNCYN